MKGEPSEARRPGGLDEGSSGSHDEWSNSEYILEAGSTGLTSRLATRCEGQKGIQADSCIGSLSCCMNADAIYLPGRAAVKPTVLLWSCGV